MKKRRAEDKFWIRRHGNGWHGIVHQFPDGVFSAGGVHQFGAIAYGWIHSLEQAEARADSDVQQKSPHSCETDKCEVWPDYPPAA